MTDQERLYSRKLLDSLAVGIVIHDAAGTVVDGNAVAMEILGLDRAALLRLSPADPDWAAIHDDGSPFPGAEHPAAVTLATGEPCRDVVMGFNRPGRARSGCRSTARC